MKYLCYSCVYVLCIALCVFGIINFSHADGHLVISEKEKKIVLKGQISKALGEYESHLKGSVEYIVCGPSGKVYESIVVVDATAKEVYKAIEKLGVKPGTPSDYDEDKDETIPPTGTSFLISVEWEVDGKTKVVRADELIYNVKTNKPLPPVAWVYSGSRVIPDLDSDDEDAMIPHAFMADHIVALRQFDGSALFQNPLPESLEENIYKKNDDILPELGTSIKMTIEVNREMQLYVLISGKVQGVGFRNFTQRNANQLGINGYAKNLANGKVEVVAVGDKLYLNELIKKLWQGPRSSKVDDIIIEERAITGEFKSFGVRY
ncbi:MAG: YdjY domain-containing protein [Candidatus Poribacteria bacterium]|nr:YdjY domain-containing protein [Candidatus Poribacteria bacterium]